MIRHGYVNCTACHISPSGGGILTNYGKSLSQELLTYGGDSLPKKKSMSEQMDQKPEEILLGGDARILEFYVNNDYKEVLQLIPMNAHVEGAINKDDYAFVGRVGIVIGRGDGGEGDGGDGGDAINTNSFLPTLYGLYRFQEIWNIRAGIFLPSYGLNNSMHFLGTRGLMGFGFQDQRPGIEVSRLGESFSFIATISGPRGPNLGKNSTALQFQYSPTDDSKIALNYWQESDFRTLYGAWFIIPLYKNIYISADLNRQSKQNNGSGYFYYSKLGWEYKQGVHIYLMNDSSQLDSNYSFTKINRTGPGIQFFPIQHFEFDFAWLREQNKLFATQDGDYAYLLLHYYL